MNFDEWKNKVTKIKLENVEMWKCGNGKSADSLNISTFFL